MTRRLTTRNAEIASAIASGLTSEEAAAPHGITAARARQIAADEGVPSRARQRTGRTVRGATAVLVRLAADELAEIELAAGGRARVASYLRAAGVEAARLTGVQVDRLAAFPGDTTREQLDTVLAIAEQQAKKPDSL